MNFLFVSLFDHFSAFCFWFHSQAMDREDDEMNK